MRSCINYKSGNGHCDVLKALESGHLGVSTPSKITVSQEVLDEGMFSSPALVLGFGSNLKLMHSS